MESRRVMSEFQRRLVAVTFVSHNRHAPRDMHAIRGKWRHGDTSVAEDYTHLYYVRKQASHSTFATNPSSLFFPVCVFTFPQSCAIIQARASIA